MIRINEVQEFDGPLDLMLKAREERFNRQDLFPNLKPLEVISKKEDDEKITLKRNFEVKAIPAQFRQFAKGGKFTFLEESVWDKKTNVQTWDIANKEWKNIISWSGQTAYEQLGEGESARTRRTLTGEVKVSAPIFAKKLEEMIVEGFVKNFQKDKKTIDEMLEILKKEG